MRTTTSEYVKTMFPRPEDSTLAALVALDMASAPPEVGISAMREIFRYNLAEAFREVKAPVRAICSDKNPVDVEGNDSIASSFKVKFMPGLGHFLHMEDPETFNGLMEETLAEFWPPAKQD